VQRKGTPEWAQEQTERLDWLRGWLRRRLVNKREFAALVGLSYSAVHKKLKGERPITDRMYPALRNIDKIIARGDFPENCSPRMRRNIVTRRIR
jgi:hypothetical protein